MNVRNTSYGTFNVTIVAPPLVTITSPAPLSTLPLDFLYLNGLSEGGAQAIRQDATLPRNVFSRDAFGLDGQIVSTGTVDSVTLEVRETDAIGNIIFPYPADGDPNQQSALLQMPALHQFTCESNGANFSSFHIDSFASGLLDSSRFEDVPSGGAAARAHIAPPPPPPNTQEVFKIYLFTIRAHDTAGNNATQSFWVKVDTQAPSTATYLFGQQPPLPPPTVGLPSDTVRASMGGRPLLLDWPNGSWLLGLGGEPYGGQSFTVQAEDMAGNSGPVSFIAIDRSFFLSQETNSSTWYWNWFIGWQADPVRTEFGIRNGKAPPPDKSIGGTSTVSLFEIDLGTVTLANPQTGARHTGVEMPPSWDAGRTYVLKVDGSFPFDTRGAYTIPGGIPLTPPQLGGVLAHRLMLLPSAFAAGQPTTSIAPGAASDSNFTNTDFGGLAYVPRAGMQAGLNGAALSYTTTVTGTYSPAGSAMSETLVQGGVPYPFSFWNVASFTGTSQGYLLKPRAVPVYQVDPDTLACPSTLHIRGWFGDGLHPGDTVNVSFSAASGAVGTIKIASTDPLGVPQASGVGTVVIEDLQNTSAMQSLAVQVVPSSDALGVFNVTVGGNVLPRMVNVVKLDYTLASVPHSIDFGDGIDVIATTDEHTVMVHAQDIVDEDLSDEIATLTLISDQKDFSIDVQLPSGKFITVQANQQLPLALTLRELDQFGFQFHANASGAFQFDINMAQSISWTLLTNDQRRTTDSSCSPKRPHVMPRNNGDAVAPIKTGKEK